MDEKLKDELYLNEIKLLFQKGLENGSIIPFDNEFYEKMSHTYISCAPVSLHIKYFKPTEHPGKCLDRSLYMFFCFDNAILCRGDRKDLEIRYGISKARHGWIEIDDYVYDPSSLMRFEKDLYYRMYIPSNVQKCNLEEYCAIDEYKIFYEKVKNTTLQDYLPGGSKRSSLLMMIPLLKGIADNSNNQDFKNDVMDYLQSIQYDEEQLYEEMNEQLRKIGLKKVAN